MMLAPIMRTGVRHLFQGGRRWCSSGPERISAGYLAGVHHISDPADFPTFEEAYQAVALVETSLLQEFEEDLWDTQWRRFVYGSRLLSVIDSVGKDGATVRALIINESPGVVQSSVYVPWVGAAGPEVPPRPPPLLGELGTAVGGLALVAPFWNWVATHRRDSRDTRDSSPSTSSTLSSLPSVAVLGGGGCALPATLSAALGVTVVAIEPDAEVREVARRFFGAAQHEAAGLLDLQPGCGAAYIARCRAGAVDILVVDAAGGDGAQGFGALRGDGGGGGGGGDAGDAGDGGMVVAPPPLLAGRAFWADVARALASSKGKPAVVAINVVASPQKRVQLVRTVLEALPDFSLFECRIPHPVHSGGGGDSGGGDDKGGVDEVAASRARLLFAASAGGSPLLPRLSGDGIAASGDGSDGSDGSVGSTSALARQRLELELSNMLGGGKGLVDEPGLWLAGLEHIA